jgi:hypothetical protein
VEGSGILLQAEAAITRLSPMENQGHVQTGSKVPHSLCIQRRENFGKMQTNFLQSHSNPCKDLCNKDRPFRRVDATYITSISTFETLLVLEIGTLMALITVLFHLWQLMKLTSFSSLEARYHQRAL